MRNSRLWKEPMTDGRKVPFVAGRALSHLVIRLSQNVYKQSTTLVNPNIYSWFFPLRLIYICPRHFFPRRRLKLRLLEREREGERESEKKRGDGIHFVLSHASLLRRAVYTRPVSGLRQLTDGYMKPLFSPSFCVIPLFILARDYY